MWLAAWSSGFTNPRIRHQLAQIAADGSQKIPVRILPVLRREHSAGRPADAAVRVVAAWINHLRGAGAPVKDSAAATVAGLASGPLEVAVATVLDFLDPELARDQRLLDAVVRASRELRTSRPPPDHLPPPPTPVAGSIAMWTLSGFADEIDPDLDTQCRLLNELGITYLEFRSAWDVNVLDLSDDQLDEAEKILADHSLSVSSIGSPIGKVNIEDDFDAHLVRFDRAVAVAARFGAPYIRIFSFFLRRDQEPARYRDEVVRRMRVMAERAQQAGVVLLHENEKEIFGDVPDRVLDIVQSVDLPSLRLAWDAANYVQVGVRPYTSAYPLLREHTVYIQVKDALLATGEVVPAGDGDGQVRETVRALLADGYDGFFSMEPHLGSANPLGGFSGADHFVRATKAFTAILDSEGITYA